MAYLEVCPVKFAWICTGYFWDHYDYRLTMAFQYFATVIYLIYYFNNPNAFKIVLVWLHLYYNLIQSSCFVHLDHCWPNIRFYCRKFFHVFCIVCFSLWLSWRHSPVYFSTNVVYFLFYYDCSCFIFYMPCWNLCFTFLYIAFMSIFWNVSISVRFA